MRGDFLNLLNKGVGGEETQVEHPIAAKGIHMGHWCGMEGGGEGGKNICIPLYF